MKKIYNIVLNSDCDKQTFLSSIMSHENCTCVDDCCNIPNVIVLELDDAEVDSIRSRSEVRAVEVERPAFEASRPGFNYQNSTFTAVVPSTSSNGANYAPVTFWAFTNHVKKSGFPGSTLGTHSTDTYSSREGTYASIWSGKNVDIVTLEVSGGQSSYTNVHLNHPEFRDPDDPNVSRVVAMDWPDGSGANLQVTNGRVMTAHALGVTSLAAGRYCGFAKRASIRVAYLTGAITSDINRIITWHNSKPVNPDTGVKNPTIMIAEYQYLRAQYNAMRLSNISRIVDQGLTINRPVGGWTDFTPFTSRNMIPKRVWDDDTLQREWCIVCPDSAFSALTIALEAAWDAGIVNINAAGNDGGVYVKNSDPRWWGTYIVGEAGGKIYYIDSTTNGTVVNPLQSNILSNNVALHPFQAFGPGGLDKGIDVAAGQASGSKPILDLYSSRGPGVDMVGIGAYTWSAYPSSLYSDGNRWGMFSGTSAATPTVVGVAACLMEEFFFYNNRWPTPSEVKSMLIRESEKDVLLDSPSTNWSAPPSASSSLSNSDQGPSTATGILGIRSTFTNLNGGVLFGELAGTPNRRAFFRSFIKTQSFTNVGERPVSGAVYPRPRIKRTS